MSGSIKWMDGKLYLKSGDMGGEWLPYNSPKYSRLKAPDYLIKDGSPGFSTMQKLLKLGWTYDVAE